MRLPSIAFLTAAVIGSGAITAPAQAQHEPLPPGRRPVQYTVRPGDTATALAVRFHAWTAELISHNHLGPSATLVAGQQIEIPVVRSAVPGGDRDRSGPTPDPPRERVRSTIAAVARHRDVDPQLALAVSWQEAGWQMHHVSDAGAIGAMQVLPDTADWMEWYVGRDLHPRRLHDNAVTGVTLLKVLGASTGSRRHQLAAYYQGLGAVQEHGLYRETRPYVDNVQAIKRRLERGQPPA